MEISEHAAMIFSRDFEFLCYYFKYYCGVSGSHYYFIAQAFGFLPVSTGLLLSRIRCIFSYTICGQYFLVCSIYAFSDASLLPPLSYAELRIFSNSYGHSLRVTSSLYYTPISPDMIFIFISPTAARYMARFPRPPICVGHRHRRDLSRLMLFRLLGYTARS